MKRLEEYVRSIPDFPEPGIIFRDVTTILQDADGLELAVNQLKARVSGSMTTFSTNAPNLMAL